MTPKRVLVKKESKVVATRLSMNEYAVLVHLAERLGQSQSTVLKDGLAILASTLLHDITEN